MEQIKIIRETNKKIIPKDQENEAHWIFHVENDYILIYKYIEQK